MTNSPTPMSKPSFVYGASLLAFAVTLRLLLFRKIMGLPICALWWYQRLALDLS